MSSVEGKLIGLRRYHAERPARTRSKLLEALDRMERGQTVVVKPGFTWSKTALAREAGININTVVRKLPGGAWAFPEVNLRFENLRRKRRKAAIANDSNEQMIIELRGQLREVREQNRRLALEVNRLGQRILQERDRADKMAAYEKQNALLRDEIMHRQTLDDSTR